MHGTNEAMKAVPRTGAETCGERDGFCVLNHTLVVSPVVHRTRQRMRKTRWRPDTGAGLLVMGALGPHP